MQIIELIGRIFISLVFLIAGFGKIFSYENTIDYMESFGVPGYLLIPAIIVEILFPLLVIIGYKTKSSALILALFSLLLVVIYGLWTKYRRLYCKTSKFSFLCPTYYITLKIY